MLSIFGIIIMLVDPALPPKGNKKTLGWIGLVGVVVGLVATFIQAQNTMNTLAKESGGAHFPMTFESEVPGILNNINSMLRSQYALSYDLGENHEPGKKYKLEVKVDVDGDGVYDDKAFVVQARPYLEIPKKAAAPTGEG